ASAEYHATSRKQTSRPRTHSTSKRGSARTCAQRRAALKSPSPRSAQHDAASSHPPRERRRGLLRRRRRLRLARRRHHLPLRRHHLPLRRRLGPLAVARKARLRAVSRTRLGRASHAPRGRGFAVARRARLRVGVVTH
ncbi:hypothetical protein EMIHUDRAFT_434446, partial [Emiliania huxleyi CCMP1516]|uniref:Uncharacterized protein n=2 Tax=Emiliania huxleyi TaxID=2903 RepID=A0A0D3K2I1_EMIH1